MPIGILYNSCYGGFDVSKEFMTRFHELGGKLEERRFRSAIDGIPFRTDPIAIQTFIELGSKQSSASCANIDVMFLADYVRYVDIAISDYDGDESVDIRNEKHIQDMLSQRVFDDGKDSFDDNYALYVKWKAYVAFEDKLLEHVYNLCEQKEQKQIISLLTTPLENRVLQYTRDGENDELRDLIEKKFQLIHDL